MKKILLLSVGMISLSLFSCKKEAKVKGDSNTPTYHLNFTVTGFAATVSPITPTTGVTSRKLLSANAVSVGAVVKYLTALFYDNNSVLLQRVDQTSMDGDFGTFNVALSANAGHVFFIATNDNSFNITLSTANSANLSKYPKGYPVLTYPPSTSSFPPATSGLPTSGDFYTKSIDFTASGNSTTTSVVLSRAVSQITIKLDDILPTIAYNQNIYLNMPVGKGSLDLVNNICDANSSSLIVPLYPAATDIGTKNFWRTIYIYPSAQSGVILSSGTTSKFLTVPNGVFAADTQYVYEGTLFNPTGNFSILLNYDWLTPVKSTF